MTESYKKSFEWCEVCDLFHIQESEELEKEKQEEILRKINSLTDKLGRDYVIRKVALNTH